MSGYGGDRPSTLSESSRITLSLVIIIVSGVVMAGVAWARISSLEDRQDRFGTAFKDLRDKNDNRSDQMLNLLMGIKEDVGKIKGRLKVE